MIAIQLEKKRGNSHDCLFLKLVLQCFGRAFFFFLSSFLFVYLIVCFLVCFVYEHFTCTWGTQALLLHMYPCTHYKLSNWYQYSILCSRPKTPILEFEFECEYWYEIYENSQSKIKMSVFFADAVLKLPNKSFFENLESSVLKSCLISLL